MLIFWISLSLLLYPYILYPIILYFLALVRNVKVAKQEIFPSVSIIITAFNESENIAKKIANTLCLDYPEDKLEIIVASDGSTDDTDSIVEGYEQVRLVRVEGRVGKTQTQNVAVSMAKGDILVFSDAASMYEQDAVKKLVRNFNDNTVGGVGGRCKYVSPTESGSTFWATYIYWEYEIFLKKCQTKIGTLTGTSGLIYAIRKELYTPLPSEIISDMVEPLMIVKQNRRFVYESEAVANEYTTTTISQEFKMRVRVISRGMSGMLYVRELLNPFKYPWVSFQLTSHKILRWLSPFLIILMVISNFAIYDYWAGYRFLMFLEIAFAVFCVLSVFIKCKGILLHLQNVSLYFVTVTLASLVSFFQVIRSEVPTTWETDRLEK